MQDSLCSNPSQAEQPHFCIPSEAVILGLLTLGMHRGKNTELETSRGEICSTWHGEEEGKAHR